MTDDMLTDEELAGYLLATAFYVFVLWGDIQWLLH